MAGAPEGARPRGRLLALATTFPRWRGDSEPPFVWELTRRLQARGWACDVLVPHAPGAALAEEWEGVRIRRFRYAPDALERVCYEGGALPNLRASWRARAALPLLLAQQRRAIGGMIRGGGYHVCHCHWLIPQGTWAAGPCREAGVPLVLTAHAGDVFGLRFPLTGAARLALDGAAAVTANSRATAEAVEAIGAGPAPVIIPMGVDLGQFRRGEEVEALPGDPAILAVGRLVEKKGFHVLLEAMPQVARALPGCHLHLVGFGPWRQRLEDQARALGLTGRVTFHGAVPHERLARLFTAADLFVQPSMPSVGGDKEGLGVTILEAMAAGAPVVASASGGIVDVIEDGASGALASPGDAGALARRIPELWRHPEREAIARRAREEVEARFGWEGVADRFDALLLKAAGRGR